jgi:antitoxin component YwqK of YwqJK toxin-antitoxin module
MTTENYINGKLDGLRTVYFPKGKVAEQIYYVNNQKQGAYKKYTENGVLIEESFYKNNEYNGLAIFRDVNGIIVSKGMFTDGIKTGIWDVLENGKIVQKNSDDLAPKAKKVKKN